MARKLFTLVSIWADGSEMKLTEPTTRRAALLRAAEQINTKWSENPNNADRVEVRPA